MTSITNEELERMGRASLEQVESRLQQLTHLARVAEAGASWQPPRWASHLDHASKLRWMAGVYGELQGIMRRRLGLVALLAMALAGCGQAVRTQVSVTYTDGPCAVTVQSWR